MKSQFNTLEEIIVYVYGEVERGASRILANQGKAVPVGGTTNLYLRFDAPTRLDSDDASSHTITVEVSCKQAQ